MNKFYLAFGGLAIMSVAGLFLEVAFIMLCVAVVWGVWSFVSCSPSGE